MPASHKTLDLAKISTCKMEVMEGKKAREYQMEARGAAGCLFPNAPTRSSQRMQHRADTNGIRNMPLDEVSVMSSRRCSSTCISYTHDRNALSAVALKIVTCTWAFACGRLKNVRLLIADSVSRSERRTRAQPSMRRRRNREAAPS